MAQCKQTPHEFIKDAFTPQIAVLCSPEAEKSCRKNNLNFVELLQPFSKLNSDIYYKDQTGNTVCVNSFKLSFINLSVPLPDTSYARKCLNASVSETSEPRYKEVIIGDTKLDIPTSTPWFEMWRETFLRVQYPSDHEFTKHFLACVLIVSSAETSPTESLLSMNREVESMKHAPKVFKCFTYEMLRYQVILHDNVDGNLKQAEELFETVKNTYTASNCFLLRMNSRPPGPQNTDHLPDPWSQFITKNIYTSSSPTPPSSPSSSSKNLEVAQEANEIKNTNYHPLSPDNDDLNFNHSVSENNSVYKAPTTVVVHGNCLSTEDIEQIKLLIHEFTTSCLIPHIEKLITILHSSMADRKGVSKSIFSATKRWFTPNRPGASSVAVDNISYPRDAPEVQIRRLGDLYFMFGNYSLAFQQYHLAKRDYNTDQAWLHYAGALEMASLSAFMANESNRKTFDYMEEGILTYLNTCKRPQFATRATIISSECLKSKNMFGEAAHQLIRMTSEDSDLRSALLLEQAAYCFLQSKMIRKYAFHMVLAGHRYSKAAQRKHSLRCYKQAFQVYRNTGWDLACDHIHYTIGRQANNLQQFNEAVQSFSELIRGESKQTGQQQAVFLKEYLTILGNTITNESVVLPTLPVPELDINSMKVLVEPTRPLTTPGKVPAQGVTFENSYDTLENKWHKLEEMLVTESGSLPMVFKPVTTLYTLKKLEKDSVIAIVNEPIQISIQLVNRLQAVLNVKDIFLIWSYKNGDEIITNENLNSDTTKYVKTHVNKSVTMKGNSKQDLILCLTPLLTGNITIVGICYILTGSNPNDPIFIKGKQEIELFDSMTNNNDLKMTSGKINRQLEINVVPPAPCLQVTFSEMNLDFLSNELQRVSIDFQNTSTVPLKNIYLATSVPHAVCNCEFNKSDNYFYDIDDIENPSIRERYARKNHITPVPLPGDLLESGQTTTIHIWIKAPPNKGPSSIDLLIYYENVDSKSVPKYRLVRHCWNLTVQESISLECLAEASLNAKIVEEISLAIKTKNLNKYHTSISSQVRLLNVGLLSKYWQLIKDDIVIPQFINLKPQESAHLLLKAKRNVKTNSQYTNISLISNDVNLEENLKKAYLSFAKKTEKRIINIFDDTEVYDKVNDSKDGILLLQWQALVTESNNQRVVNGQTQIPIEINRRKENELQLDLLLGDIIDLNDMSSHQEDPYKAEKQVIYNLVHQPIVEHDFNKSKMCVVPVKLLLHSIVEDKEVVVTIKTTENRPIPGAQLKPVYKRASVDYTWVCVQTKFVKLSPLTSSTVDLGVVFTRSGTYDLGAHIDIFCNNLDNNDELILQSCQIQSALIVVDVNK